MERLVIVGAGFAGMHAALAAARLRDISGVSPDELEIAVVAPEPHLVIRPRLYESAPATMTAPLSPLFDSIDVRYVRASVDRIDSADSTVGIVEADGARRVLRYERLVLAAGSQLFRPNIPGLATYGFSVDQLEDAITLDRHLMGLAHRPASASRNTVVVAGGGFTGIEVATEMPSRLRAILGSGADIRVVILDRNDVIAPAMGPNPRPLIEQALQGTGVETRLGAGVEALDATGVTLSNGERIESATVIWAGGMRASPLTAQLEAECDRSGRVIVDADLRVPGTPQVFAAGDTARAVTDSLGHVSLMSCQHANRLGAVAGYNAAADLLGVATEPYRQKNYVTCLDLGPTAIFTRGWDSQVEITGDEAKAMKREINTKWIYPPRADRTAAFETSEWARLVDY